MSATDALRVFEHDGSFAGFLCAVAELLNALADGDDPRRCDVAAASRPAAFFEEREGVARDEGRAEQFLSRLRSRAGEAVVQTVLEAFCSDLEGAAEATARMIAGVWRDGRVALDELGDPDALLVEKAALRARREAHLFTGLLRFSELLDASLFASIDPDCDLLVLIGDHFSARFPLFRWAIRDERRDTAILHEAGGPWKIVHGLHVAEGWGGMDDDGLPLSRDEASIRECWRRYFESVAIGERRNPRLQASHMPRKYWKNLTEKRGRASTGLFPAQ
ncbi:MAG: TIGR03915 family putative DNA repair protein [Spirochaetota bacterium]